MTEKLVQKTVIMMQYDVNFLVKNFIVRRISQIRESSKYKKYIEFIVDYFAFN